MKKILFLILALALVGVMAVAQADTYYVYTANGGSLNLRSPQDNSVIARIPYGTRLETDDNLSTETAAYVTYGSKSGYVKWEFLVKQMPGRPNSAPATAAPAQSGPQMVTLPTIGDGEITIQAIGASIQFGQGGQGFGTQYSAVSYDTPMELVITADRSPEYWVIDGVRYDFEPAVPKSFVLQNAWDTVIVEAVPKNSISRTLLSADDIQAFRTGDQLIVQAIHSKLCHVNRNNYGAGGWLDWFDFTNDYINRATNQWEQGGQVTTRIRATIPKGKKISYWKFDDMYIDFSTDVTQFLVHSLNVSKVYEPVFAGKISTATAAPNKATRAPSMAAPTPTPTMSFNNNNVQHFVTPTPTPNLNSPTAAQPTTPGLTRVTPRTTGLTMITPTPIVIIRTFQPYVTPTPTPTIFFSRTLKPLVTATPTPFVFTRTMMPLVTATPTPFVFTRTMMPLVTATPNFELVVRPGFTIATPTPNLTDIRIPITRFGD